MGTATAAQEKSRGYLWLRVMSLVAAVLTLVSVGFVFVLKNSPAGLIGSIVAVVVFFMTFQILHRKRRALFMRVLVREEEPPA